MEEWGYVDERDLQNWKVGVICMNCQHFTYCVDHFNKRLNTWIIEMDLGILEGRQRSLCTQ